MTPSVKRGLQIAKHLLREMCMDFAQSSRHADALATVKWIAHQEKIDQNRRKPRKLR